MSSKKDLAFHWLGITPLQKTQENFPLKNVDMIKYLHVTEQTFYKWKKEYEKSPSYDSIKWLTGRTEKMDEALVKACLAGKVSAIELFYKIGGRLTDKKEVKHTFELSADEHRRIRDEAIRRIQESNRGSNGDRSVLPIPQILLNEVCLDTEPQHGEEDKVVAVGLPVRPA